MKSIHVLVNGGMFTCPVKCGQDGCMRTFRYPRALVRHIEANHNEINNEIDEHAEFGDMDSDEDNGLIHPLAVNHPVQLDVEEFSSDVTKSAAIFLAKMKASSSTVQSTVDHVVSGSTELFSSIISRLKQETEQYLETQNIDPNDPGKEQLISFFNQCENPFQDLETAHQQQKYFINNGHFVKPREIPVGVAYNPRNNRETGHVEQIAKHVTFQYIPLRDLLKCILESKGFMKAMMEHRPSQDGIMRDFHDGTFCKEHEFFSKENIIRLLLFVDDCEIANPLGSKAGLHKTTMVYFIVLNIPPRLRSSLNNCYLVALFNAGDVKTYGYAPFLQPIVKDIKFLEQEGISISTEDFQGNVLLRAGIAQLTGDNLGVNGILGFVESFMSNHYCRFCNMHRNEMQNSSTADPEQLRNVRGYENDLEKNNYTETGIKSHCALNDVGNFHVATNYAPDIMHDLLEGVCGLEVYLVIAQLIGEGLFDLDLLNSRITSFDYSTTDAKNKPSPISLSKLQQPDGAAGQTATQMWCLIRNLPLLIGDKVPEEHPYFELLLQLLECMDFIFCPEITIEETFFLKHLIKEHHEYFLDLFPDRTLKPKHHFMTHYPQQIRLLGPLVHFWTMRFEAKHRFFKRLAHIVCNFKNILKTLSYRHQMFLCCHIMSSKDVVERDLEVGPGSKEMIASLTGAELIVRALAVNMFDDVYVAKWCVVHGIKYCKNLMVITGKTDDLLPSFHQILYIIVGENNNIYLQTQKWTTIAYDRHTHSYVIEEPEETICSLVSVHDLYDYYPYHASKSYKTDDLLSYVVLRHRIH
jgi:hypothetical protein